MSAGNDIAGARPRIAVVIVTFNSGDVLEDALESLRAQTGCCTASDGGRPPRCSSCWHS
jgi:hypothetical protein